MIVLLFFQVVGCSGTAAVAKQSSTQNGQDAGDAGHPALPSWELARALTCWVIQCTRFFFFIEPIWFAVGFQHNSKAFLGDICVFSNTVVWKTGCCFFFCFLFHLIEFSSFFFFSCILSLFSFYGKELQTIKWIGFPLPHSFLEKKKKRKSRHLSPPHNSSSFGLRILRLAIDLIRTGSCDLSCERAGRVCKFA